MGWRQRSRGEWQRLGDVLPRSVLAIQGFPEAGCCGSGRRGQTLKVLMVAGLELVVPDESVNCCID